MNRGIGIAAALVAVLSAAASPAAPTAMTPEEDAQVSALAKEIVVTASRLPAGSPERAYEAQFAALFANNQYSCTIVRAAIARTAGVPKIAAVALRDVNDTLTTCGGGTAAIPGGVLSTASTPGFAVGGSDYTR